jgi:hypothetical protein|tara:strand:- start:546 stop:1304 length:759 start_codon:yes stop_codon:yes gene_type:complete
MKIKRFTNEGRKEWIKLYREIFISIDKQTPNRRSAKEGIEKGYNKNLQKKIELLKKDNTLSTPVDGAQDLDLKDYKNSYELGSALDTSLKNISYKDLFDDLNLWDCLSLNLFDKIFVPGKIKGFMPYRYVVDVDRNNSMRHLVRGPWWAVNRYGENAKIFTYTEVYQQNDFFEQFVKVNSLRELKVIAEVCMRLYFDKENNRSIPGTSKGTRGGFARLRDKISHYNKIKFLWNMNTNEIIDMLPSEFDKYKI